MKSNKQPKKLHKVVLPTDAILMELAKETCMLHRMSDDLGFLVMFDLNDLRTFCTKLLQQP